VIAAVNDHLILVRERVSVVGRTVVKEQSQTPVRSRWTPTQRTKRGGVHPGWTAAEEEQRMGLTSYSTRS
jgi:hypothetical protein